ncbi:STE/STE20 protein kinase [Fonticula alba]|uniref:non-specific serine/threonine protein kinase n=1 Tax=Fonticula alba TaxID=691883 RepID=A0A058Z9C6_FONAL|nr:STE/STE20 protein kinase [Fonticula alba]KCV70914.1 STE/STE20 protein kinase [Fonticula alba]|eukprot:XP_009494037.1 STE/STE20 protein kinase [Fonticula alba]
MLETLKGLSYLHDRAILHRDMKCGNILLTARGEIKIVDFGISVIMEHPTQKRNTFVGTPYWMSPELIACDKDATATYDIACDIWAAGICAIELYDTDPPLAEYHPLRALFLIPNSPPPTVRNPRRISRQFRDFLGSCLAKNPAERLTARQLLEHPFLKSSRFSLRKKPSAANHVLREVLEQLDMGPPEEVLLSHDMFFHTGGALTPGGTAGSGLGSGMPGSLPPLDDGAAEQGAAAAAGAGPRRASALRGLRLKIDLRPGNLFSSSSQRAAAAKRKKSQDAVVLERGEAQRLYGQRFHDVDPDADPRDRPPPDAAASHTGPSAMDMTIQQSLAMAPIQVAAVASLPHQQHGADVGGGSARHHHGPGGPGPGAGDDSDHNSSGDSSSDSYEEQDMGRFVRQLRDSALLSPGVDAMDGASPSSLLAPATPTAGAGAGAASSASSSPSGGSPGAGPASAGVATTSGIHVRTVSINHDLALVAATGAVPGTTPITPLSPEAALEAARADERVDRALAAAAAAAASAVPLPRPDGDTHIKMFLAKERFNLDISCSTMFLETRWLFGTPDGLFQLDKVGDLTKLGSGAFHVIQPVTEYGVLASLCGKRLGHQIRLYSLPLLAQIATGQRTVDSSLRLPYRTVPSSRGCRQFSLIRSGGTVFLCAAVRNSAVLYMWSASPQNNFMIIDSWPLPDSCLAVEPILDDAGVLTHIIAQCTSLFVLINIKECVSPFFPLARLASLPVLWPPLAAPRRPPLAAMVSTSHPGLDPPGADALALGMSSPPVRRTVLDADDPPSAPDDWQLITSLGEGNYGSVHKAIHLPTGGMAAIKCVPWNDADIQEIQTEINILESCHSPNVVSYFSTHFLHDTLWLCMELCPGGSFMDIMQSPAKVIRLEEKDVPHSLAVINHRQPLLVYRNSGFFLDVNNFRRVGPIFSWRNTPMAVLPIRENKILSFGASQIDVFWRHTGELIQTVRDFECQKLRYLMRRHGDDLVVASRVGPAIMNIHIIRSLGEQRRPASSASPMV